MTEQVDCYKRMAAMERVLWAWFNWEDDGTGGPDIRDYTEEGTDILETLMAETSAVLSDEPPNR